MAEYDGIPEYHRSGQARLRGAEELLQPPTLFSAESNAETRHLRGAIYIAGYAIENVLKEYLLNQSREKSLAAWMDARRTEGLEIPNLLSAEGHHLVLLMMLTRLEASMIGNQKCKQDWGICTRWKSTWRYDSRPVTVAYARDFVVACRRFHQWVSRQMD